MKIRNYFLLAVVLAFFAGLGYLNRGKSMGLGGPGRAWPGQARFFAEFMVPISFYGRAVDQHGNPVGGAKVYFSANDLPWGDGSKYRIRSDADGRFQLTGARGSSLYVEVTKEGYDIWRASSGAEETKKSFKYGLDRGQNYVPDKNNPVVFTLRKLGEMEPLEVRPEFKFAIPRDGSWRLISLHQDKNPAHGINFRCVSKLDTAGSKRFYDWEFEISVPKGGVVERTDKNLFQAPEAGYKPSDKVVMSGTQQRWTEFLHRGYFIRFEDGVYARIELLVAVRERQLVICESWMNLKAGSRQLEVEPVQWDN